MEIEMSNADLLKENQSLRSELQKQKELNAELVEGLESVLRLRNLIEYTGKVEEKHIGEAWAINGMLHTVESLIKKSKES